jgi:carboxymethylenebutenolidase
MIERKIVSTGVRQWRVKTFASMRRVVGSLIVISARPRPCKAKFQQSFLPRQCERSQPRLQRIQEGEIDMIDTLAMLRKHAQFSGRSAVIGFCYGGPYAIIGPKRLGYDAGVSCHGTQMLDYIGEIDSVSQPVCIIWGDQDFAAPAPVQEAYRQVPNGMKNVEVHLIPGVVHGYMMRDAGKAYNAEARTFSMNRTLALLAGLRGK